MQQILQMIVRLINIVGRAVLLIYNVLSVPLLGIAVCLYTVIWLFSGSPYSLLMEKTDVLDNNIVCFIKDLFFLDDDGSQGW